MDTHTVLHTRTHAHTHTHTWFVIPSETPGIFWWNSKNTVSFQLQKREGRGAWMREGSQREVVRENERVTEMRRREMGRPFRKRGRVKEWGMLMLVQAMLWTVSGKSHSICLQITVLLSLSLSLPSPTTFLHDKCTILPGARQAASMIFHNMLHAFPFWNSSMLLCLSIFLPLCPPSYCVVELNWKDSSVKSE